MRWEEGFLLIEREHGMLLNAVEHHHRPRMCSEQRFQPAERTLEKVPRRFAVNQSYHHSNSCWILKISTWTDLRQPPLHKTPSRMPCVPKLYSNNDETSEQYHEGDGDHPAQKKKITTVPGGRVRVLRTFALPITWSCLEVHPHRFRLVAYGIECPCAFRLRRSRQEPSWWGWRARWEDG